MTFYHVPLKIAADNSLTPNLSGVYILELNSKIMKVGSAKIGIQKRMQQYYNLNRFCGLNEFINKENRDYIMVTYQTCSYDECTELESKLFKKYGYVNSMPWAKRAPHSTSNATSLLI